MTIVYPAKLTVSVWVGTFADEAAFDDCVNKLAQRLRLPTDIERICEVVLQQEPVPVADLITGFSGWETFSEAANSAATAKGIALANAALVCYFLSCLDAPDRWGQMTFLGSLPGNDRTGT